MEEYAYKVITAHTSNKAYIIKMPSVMYRNKIMRDITMQIRYTKSENIIKSLSILELHELITRSGLDGNDYDEIMKLRLRLRRRQYQRINRESHSQQQLRCHRILYKIKQCISAMILMDKQQQSRLATVIGENASIIEKKLQLPLSSFITAQEELCNLLDAEYSS